MTKEIVTLSFGSYASFVSAHFWNIQDEAAGCISREGWSDYATCIDHNVLFEESEGRNGVSTYHPRAVLFDMAGSSGGVPFTADTSTSLAAAAAAPVFTWTGSCEVHRTAPVGRSLFLERLSEQEELDWDSLGDDEAARQQAALEAAARQLDPAAGGAAAHGDVAAAGADARHWTDFCKVLFSPRSLFTLPGYWAGPMEHSLVGGWGAAAELLGTGFGGSGGGGAMVEEAVDRVRLQGEACDSLAGFQVLTDDLTGFGAISSAVMSEVVEEYRGRPAVVFSLRQQRQSPEQQVASGRDVGQ